MDTQGDYGHLTYGELRDPRRIRCYARGDFKAGLKNTTVTQADPTVDLIVDLH